MTSSKRKSFLDLISVTLKLINFSIKTKAYKGFYDWNISYQRVFEYGEAFKIIKKENPKSMLDVGGDNSIFAPFVTRHLNCMVDITDMGDMKYSKRLVKNLSYEEQKLISLIPKTKSIELGLKKYDIVTCLSAMEHFDNNEDVVFVKNSKNLLNHNGILIITSPFTNAKETIHVYRDLNYYKAHDQKQVDEGFYEKKYSLSNIRKLVKESDLFFERLYFGGEIINFFDPIFQYQPNPSKYEKVNYFNGFKIKMGRIFLIYIHLLSPFWPFLFMRKSNNISDFSIESKRKKAGCPDSFVLVLRKK